jgi:hypothetical protein
MKPTVFDPLSLRERARVRGVQMGFPSLNLPKSGFISRFLKRKQNPSFDPLTPTLSLGERELDSSSER